MYAIQPYTSRLLLVCCTFYIRDSTVCLKENIDKSKRSFKQEILIKYDMGWIRYFSKEQAKMYTKQITVPMG